LSADPLSVEKTQADDPVSAMSQRYKPFTEALVERGKMRESEVVRAERLALQTDETRFPALLLKLGILSERDTAEILSGVSGKPLINPDDFPEASPLPEHVSARFLKEKPAVLSPL